MSIQYPAGTGFDPRMQRPRGQNVGQIGNIYLPQEEPQEQDNGIDAGDVIGTLAALAGAGALGLAGYRGVAGRNLWDRPNPAAATTAAAQKTYTRPETQVRQAAARPSYGELWDRTTGPIPSRPTEASISTRLLPAGAATEDLPSTVINVGSTKNLFRNLPGIRTGSPLTSDELPVSTVISRLFGKTPDSVVDVNFGGNALSGNTLTDLQKVDSQAVGQTAQVNRKLQDLGLWDQKPGGASASEMLASVIGVPEEEQAMMNLLSGRGSNIQLDDLWGVTNQVETPKVRVAKPITTTRTKPIRPSEPLEPGNTINYGGKNQFVLDSDGKYAFIEDDDGNIGALRILDSPDAVFEPEDVLIEDYLGGNESYELSGAQRRKLDLGKPAISYAKEVARTLGIPLKDASDALAVQMGIEAGKGNKPISKFFIANPTDDQIASSNSIMAQFREAKKAQDVQKAIEYQDAQNSGRIAQAEIAAGKKAEEVFDVGNAAQEHELERPGIDTLGTQVLDEFTTPVFSAKIGESVLLPTPGAALTAYATPEFGIPLELGRKLTGLGDDGNPIPGVKALIAKTPDEYTGEDKLVLYGIKQLIDEKAKEGLASTVARHIISGGELVDTQTKGLGWLVDQDPAKTRVSTMVPGARTVLRSRRQNSTKYDYSDQSALIRNALSGRVGSPRELGISNGRGGSGADSTGISRDLGRFIVGFDNPLKGLTRINNAGSGKLVIRPGEDVVSVIGETDADMITKADRTTNMTPEIGLKRLIKEMMDGRTTFTAEGSYGGYERTLRRNPFYNPIKIVPETGEGVVQAVGDRQIRLDKNGKPFVVPGRATSMNIEGARTKAAIDGDKEKYGTYAPAGVDGTGNKLFSREIEISPYDEYIGAETAAYLQGLSGESLNPSQKQYVDKLIETAQKNPNTLSKAAALLRMTNDAAKNSNEAGERLNKIIERGLSNGVELSSVLPNLVGSVPGGDFYAAFTTAGNKSRTGRTVQESIPVTINRALKADRTLAGKKNDNATNANKFDSQLGANALASVIDSANVGGSNEGQRIVGELQKYVDKVAQARGEQSTGITILTPFRTGSGGERHEQRRVQVPGQAIAGGLRDEMEEIIGTRKEGGKGFGNQNISNKAKAYQKRKEKENEKSQIERRGLRRANTIDAMNEQLANNAEYVGKIDTEASEEQARKYAHGDSALDDLLKIIQSTPDKEGLDQATFDRVSKSIEDIEGIESGLDMVDTNQNEDITDEYVYARPSVQPSTRPSDPENLEIVTEYLTKIKGGEKQFRPIRIKSKSGSALIDLTDASKERAMQARTIDDPNGKPVQKWLGGYVKPSAQNIRDYWVPEETRSHWSDLADRYPDGIYAIAAAEGVSPVEMQTRILDNPDGYSEKVLLQAARQLEPEYEYSARSGMTLTPVTAKAVDMKMQQMGLPPSKEIQDYVEFVSMPGYEYSGNSPIELAGRIAAETAGGLNDKRSLSLKVNRPGAQEAGTGRSLEYAGGMIDDSEGSAVKTLQQIIRSANNATGSTSPVTAEQINSNISVGQQLGQVLGLTQDLESDPIRDTLFYKKYNGRFGLTPLGRRLKFDDQNSERPALSGRTALSTVLPREAKEQQREVRRGEKRAAKQENAQIALQKLSNELADVPTGQNVGGSALAALNQIMGIGGSKEIKNINQALKRAGLRSSSREQERIPALEVLGDPKTGEAQFIQTQAVIEDPYARITGVQPTSRTTAARDQLRSQQAENLGELTRNYLGSNEVGQQVQSGNVPLVSAESILRESGLSLAQFIDTYGTDPGSIARNLNSRTSSGARQQRSSQRSLFSTAPYRSEGLATYMTPQGRIARGTQLEISQAQNATQQQQMGNRNNQAGMQLGIPGLGVNLVNLNG